MSRLFKLRGKNHLQPYKKEKKVNKKKVLTVGIQLHEMTSIGFSASHNDNYQVYVTMRKCFR